MTEHTFIAIRKEPSVVSLKLQDMPLDERRAQLVENAAHSEHADQLIDRGFEPVSPTGTSTKQNYRYESIQEDEPKFRRMSHVGAYQVSAPNPEQKQAALEVFGDDYIIIPDIHLDNPDVTPDSNSAKFAKHDWPEDSGILQAHTQGIKGKGVLIGVLDTGCDADHEQFNDKRIDFLYVNPTDPHSSKAKHAFDVDVHGTHVCGILVGKEVGIAPEAKLLVASVIESESNGTSIDRILFALDWMLSKFVEPENQARACLTIREQAQGD